MLHPCYRILCSNKKGKNHGIPNSLNTSQKHSAERRKAVSGCYKLLDSICVTSCESTETQTSSKSFIMNRQQENLKGDGTGRSACWLWTGGCTSPYIYVYEYMPKIQFCNICNFKSEKISISSKMMCQQRHVASCHTSTIWKQKSYRIIM